MTYNPGLNSGFGTVRKTVKSDNSNYKFVFESDYGKIFFNEVDENQIKGIQFVTDLNNEDLKELS